MIKWCKIKKRKDNAFLYGVDLGEVTPFVNVKIQREEELRPPKVNPPKVLLPVKKKKK